METATSDMYKYRKGAKSQAAKKMCIALGLVGEPDLPVDQWNPILSPPPFPAKIHTLADLPPSPPKPLSPLTPLATPPPPDPAFTFPDEDINQPSTSTQHTQQDKPKPVITKQKYAHAVHYKYGFNNVQVLVKQSEDKFLAMVRLIKSGKRVSSSGASRLEARERAYFKVLQEDGVSVDEIEMLCELGLKWEKRRNLKYKMVRLLKQQKPKGPAFYKNLKHNTQTDEDDTQDGTQTTVIEIADDE